MPIPISLGEKQAMLVDQDDLDNMRALWTDLAQRVRALEEPQPQPEPNPQPQPTPEPTPDPIPTPDPVPTPEPPPAPTGLEKVNVNTLYNIWQPITPDLASCSDSGKIPFDSTLGDTASVFTSWLNEFRRESPGGHKVGYGHITAFSITTGLYRLVAKARPLIESLKDSICIGLNPDGTQKTILASLFAPDPVYGWGSATKGVQDKHTSVGPPADHNHGTGVLADPIKKVHWHFHQQESWPVNEAIGWNDIWKSNPAQEGMPNDTWTYVGKMPPDMWGTSPIPFMRTGKYCLINCSNSGMFFNSTDDLESGKWDYSPSVRVMAWGSTKYFYCTAVQFDPTVDKLYILGRTNAIMEAAFSSSGTPYPAIIGFADAGWNYYQGAVQRGDWLYQTKKTGKAILRFCVNKANPLFGKTQVLSWPSMPGYDASSIDVASHAVIGDTWYVDLSRLGVWRFPFPTEDAGWETYVPLPARGDPQAVVAGMQSGGEVTFLAGQYSGPLVITVGGTYNMKGARFQGLYQGKAQIVVQTPEPVTLNDPETVDVLYADNAVAGIRTVGVTHLTVNRPYGRNLPSGIITSNEVGSTIEINDPDYAELTGDRTKNDGKDMHGIYIGRSDCAVVRGGKFNLDGTHGFGHGIKFRSRVTRVYGVKVWGDGDYQGETDYPCGGDVYEDENCVFIKGPNANANHTFFATESQTNCSYVPCDTFTAPDGTVAPQYDSGQWLCKVPGRYESHATFKIDPARTAYTQYGDMGGVAGTQISIDITKVPEGLFMGGFINTEMW